MDIIFADPEPGFTNAIDILFAHNPCVRTTNQPIHTLKRDGTAFLASCTVFLTIDELYDRHIFPYIHLPAQKKMRDLGICNAIGCPFLPVGSALCIEAIPEKHTYMICAPTMIYPQDVSGTENVFHAFMSALCLLRKRNDANIRTLVCSALCTKDGCMDPVTSAQQMYDAFQVFLHGQSPLQAGFHSDSNVYITSVRPKQPDLYENYI